jgi:membrane-bound lytic murein transglycosylase D
VHARKGDTIATLAARYDLPAGTVAGWNKTTPTARLRPGETVTLYLPARAQKATRHASAHAAKSRHKPAHAGKSSGKKSGGGKDKKKH